MHRRPLLLASLALALVACGSGEALSPEEPPATVGDVGQLPSEVVAATSAPPDAADRVHGAGGHDGDHRRVAVHRRCNRDRGGPGRSDASSTATACS